MRRALAILIAVLGGAGCEAIDNLSTFHVVDDGGADLAVADVALHANDLAGASDALRTNDLAGAGDMTASLDFAPSLDLLVVDLAAPPDLAPQLDLVPCGLCKPGDQRTIACGNCGMETDTCTLACQWSGVCVGQGVCAPGATQAGGCSPCSQQTCDVNCQWSACALKLRNACERARSCPHNCAPQQQCGNCNSPAIDSCQNCQWANVCVCATNCAGSTSCY